MENPMIEKTLAALAKQLEAITRRGISLARALDLLEASTQNLEEIIALNIMRESLDDQSLQAQKQASSKRFLHVPQDKAPELLYGLA